MTEHGVDWGLARESLVAWWHRTEPVLHEWIVQAAIVGVVIILVFVYVDSSGKE